MLLRSMASKYYCTARIGSLSRSVDHGKIRTMCFRPIRPTTISFMICPMMRNARRRRTGSTKGGHRTTYPRPFSSKRLRTPCRQRNCRKCTSCRRNLCRFPTVVLTYFRCLSNGDSRRRNDPRDRTTPSPNMIMIDERTPATIFVPRRSITRVPRCRPIRLLNGISFQDRIARRNRQCPMGRW